MASSEARTIQSDAKVKELVGKVGRPSRSQKRAATLFDGEVFRGKGAKGEARARRTALRNGGHEVRFRTINVDGEKVYVVKDLGKTKDPKSKKK